MSPGQSKALVLGVGAERRLGAATARRFAGEVTTSAQAGDDGDVAAGDYPRKMEAPSAFGGVQRTKRITFAEEGSPADLIVFNLGSNQPYDFRTLSAENFDRAWRWGMCCLSWRPVRLRPQFY
jgi:hypothetical protein